MERERGQRGCRRTGRLREHIVKLAGKTKVIFHKVVFHVFCGCFACFPVAHLKMPMNILNRAY